MNTLWGAGLKFHLFYLLRIWGFFCVLTGKGKQYLKIKTKQNYMYFRVYHSEKPTLSKEVTRVESLSFLFTHFLIYENICLVSYKGCTGTVWVYCDFMTGSGGYMSCWSVRHRWPRYLFFSLICLVFLLHHTVCGILVPWPGIKPKPLAVEAQSPNHWITREFPVIK